MLELEAEGKAGGAGVLLLLGITGTELGVTEGKTSTEVDVEAALASAELEIVAGDEANAADDIGCVMVETKVDKIVEIVVVV